MYLSLDPSHEGSVTLELIDNPKRDQNARPTYAKASAGKPSKTVPLHHSEELLGIIDAFLKTEKITPQDLKGIMVVNSAPRFTTIRNVITMLNTMAWTLNIPIIAKSSKKSLTRSHLVSLREIPRRGIQGETLAFKPLKPHYSAPPTITPPSLKLRRAGLPKKKKE